MSHSPEPGPGDLADRIAAAVKATPGVADLHGGVFGEVATYLVGRRVHGVRMLDPGCEVHVVLEWAAPVQGTCAAIRDTVRPLVSGPIDLTVEDIAEPRSGSS